MGDCGCKNMPGDVMKTAEPELPWGPYEDYFWRQPYRHGGQPFVPLPKSYEVARELAREEFIDRNAKDPRLSGFPYMARYFGDTNPWTYGVEKNAHVADVPTFYTYTYDELKTLRSAYEWDRFELARHYHGDLARLEQAKAIEAWSKVAAPAPNMAPTQALGD